MTDKSFLSRAVRGSQIVVEKHGAEGRFDIVTVEEVERSHFVCSCPIWPHLHKYSRTTGKSLTENRMWDCMTRFATMGDLVTFEARELLTPTTS